MMEYKGYIGNVAFDYDAMIFHGEVINTRDVITFQGKSVSELEKEFKNSINDYIKWCEEEGISPEKPYSGKFNIRISPDLHRKIAQAAHQQNISLNKFVEKVLSDKLLK